MKTILVSAILLAVGINAHAAQINVKDSEGNKYVIALDAKGTPRTDGHAKTNPTIKDFRKGGESAFYCIKGEEAEIRQLLTGLVAAADGDGDSWAELKGIYKNPRSWAVLAEITNEAGKNRERFSFPICKR